jgi:hypothetical protein
MSTITADGPARYKLTSPTTTSAVLTNGIQTVPNEAVYPVWALNGALSAQIQFFMDSSLAAFDYRIWGVNPLASGQTDPAGSDKTLRELSCLAYGTATAGTQPGSGVAGNSGVAVGAGERMAHTLTVTRTGSGTSPRGQGTAIDDAMGEGTTTAYSPANNETAKLFLGGLGRFAGLIVEKVSGTGGGNALIQNNRP